MFGDYDGDGKTDFVARRTNGTNFVWEVNRSSDGGTTYITWGLPSDQIVAGADTDEDFGDSSEWEMSNDQKSVEEAGRR